MRSRVEVFEGIRRDRRVEGLSIRALAERHQVHRRTVRQALASVVPPPRKAYARRARPAIDAWAEVIDGWLAADQRLPRKQRHTARRVWRLPTIRAEATRLAEIATRERQSYLAFLAEVLAAGVDDRADRRRARRISEARFPRIKRLADFDLRAAPAVGATQLAALASGAYLDAGNPVVLLGDSGTGKTHLLIALGVAACEQGHRVRYVTAAALANELAEAADQRALSRVVARYGRLDLLLLDELGYVQIDPRGAELLFQIITERDERASIGYFARLAPTPTRRGSHAR
jgi:DNA replication protein DnaC